MAYDSLLPRMDEASPPFFFIYDSFKKIRRQKYMESTKSFLKQFEDREHLSELDKKIERNKPAFRGPPVWITRQDGEFVPATFEDLEAAAREKLEAMVEDSEEKPKRFMWIRNLIAIFRQLWTFDREVQGK